MLKFLCFSNIYPSFLITICPFVLLTMLSQLLRKNMQTAIHFFGSDSHIYSCGTNEIFTSVLCALIGTIPSVSTNN